MLTTRSIAFAACIALSTMVTTACQNKGIRPAPNTPGASAMLEVLMVNVQGGSKGHARGLIPGDGGLWGVGSPYTVVRIGLNDEGEQQALLSAQVLSLSMTAEGEPVVLVHEPLSRNAYVLVRQKPGEESGFMDTWSISPALHGKAEDVPYALTVAADRYIVLSHSAVSTLAFSAHAWKSRTIHPVVDVMDASRQVTLLSQDRLLYFATDVGEWNGNLFRVDLQSGETKDLWSQGPITAIAANSDRPGCLWVSSGLNHIGFRSGRLVDVCGDTIESLYDGDQPIWGLHASNGHLYGLLQDGLVPLTSNGPDWEHARAVESVDKELAGYPAATMDSDLIVYSFARAEVSTSGLTPYVVTLPAGAAPVLQDRPEAACGNKK